MILVKFPSRERARTFDSVVRQYKSMQTTEDVIYFITLDSNDPDLERYKEICHELGLMYSLGESKGKIHACNRDIADPQLPNWDILVLASDDMLPQTHGWDKVLIDEMAEYFPDTDGVLYHSDGYTPLNTMCILGKKYFDRFGYIYHPDYISLWADNEFMRVSRILGKEKYFDQVLFRHEHFSNNQSVKADKLMKRNEGYYHKDKETYTYRNKINFGI